MWHADLVLSTLLIRLMPQVVSLLENALDVASTKKAILGSEYGTTAGTIDEAMSQAMHYVLVKDPAFARKNVAYIDSGSKFCVVSPTRCSRSCQSVC
jgi:hypothetical protein